MNDYKSMRLVPPTLFSKLMTELGNSGSGEAKCLNISQLNSIQNEDGGKVYISQKPETQTSHTHLPSMVNDVSQKPAEGSSNNFRDPIITPPANQTLPVSEQLNVTQSSKQSDNPNLSDLNESSASFHVGKENVGPELDAAMLQPKTTGNAESQTSFSKSTNDVGLQTSFVLPSAKKNKKSQGHHEFLARSLKDERFSTSLPVGKGFSQVYPSASSTQDMSLRLNETPPIDLPSAANVSQQKLMLDTSNSSQYGRLAEGHRIALPDSLDDPDLEEEGFEPPHVSTPTIEANFSFPNAKVSKRKLNESLGRSKVEVTQPEIKEGKPSKKKTILARQALSDKYGITVKGKKVPPTVLSRRRFAAKGKVSNTAKSKNPTFRKQQVSIYDSGSDDTDDEQGNAPNDEQRNAPNDSETEDEAPYESPAMALPDEDVPMAVPPSPRKLRSRVSKERFKEERASGTVKRNADLKQKPPIKTKTKREWNKVAKDRIKDERGNGAVKRNAANDNRPFVKAKVKKNASYVKF